MFPSSCASTKKKKKKKKKKSYLSKNMAAVGHLWFFFFSFLYLFVCFLIINQLLYPFLTILSCNLMLCLILFKFQCSHNPLSNWKSVIYGDVLVMDQNLEDLTETPKSNTNYASLSLFQKSVSSVTELLWIYIIYNFLPARLDIEGNILTQNIPPSGLRGIAITSIVYRWTDGRTPKKLLCWVSTASVCKHFLLSQLLQDQWVDVLKLVQNVPLNV